MKKDQKQPCHTITTRHTGGTPTRSMPERTREEFERDNKPTAESREKGCAFIKPMNANDW